MTLEERFDQQARRTNYETEMLHWGQYVTGNALAWARLPPDRLRSLPEYRRVADAISLLRIQAVEGRDFVRVGRDSDGGYVMLDALGPPEVTVAYSLGIGNDVSWDLAMAERGVDVRLYDHTIRGPAQPVPGGTFRREGVCGATAVPDCRTLGAILAANGHADRDDMILKMDVEGAEWDVLAEVSSDTLARFSQIVLEFHRMAKVLHPPGHAEVMAALEKLSATHVPVHVHGNNVRLPVWIGNLTFPDNLEISWVRRADHVGRFVPRRESLPGELDRPNLPHRLDHFLGWTFTGGEPVG